MSVLVIAGDFKDALGPMADESVDCILTDPPYGETSLSWDRWPKGWPMLVRRVLKRTGSMWVFGSQRMFLTHASEFVGWKFAQDVIWHKHNGSGFHADRFKRVHECALQFYRDDAPWAGVYALPQVTMDAAPRVVHRKKRPTHTGNIEAGSYESHDGGPRLMRSVIYARSEHGHARHPTQKPLAIVEPLLRYSCPRNGLVFDPFAGSGTTAVAALQQGMSALLCEANEGYLAVIDDRIAENAMFE